MPIRTCDRLANPWQMSWVGRSICRLLVIPRTMRLWSALRGILHFKTTISALSTALLKLKFMTKKVIGRIEHVDFPSLDWMDVPCRVDSGAFRSSLHCEAWRLDQDLLSVQFLPNGPWVDFSTFSTANVKSSNGSAEERYLVDLPMRIFGTIFTASFTLTDRTVMKYPALLGRTFLREGFLVDVRRKDVSKKQRTRPRS